MVNKQYVKSYILYLIPMLLPFPGRLAFGIVLVLSFNLLIVFGALFQHALHALKMESMQSVMLVPLLVGVSVLSQQLLTLYSPVISLQLGILMYFPALSSFLISEIHATPHSNLKDELSISMTPSLYYSLFVLIFMLFRDIFGYGALSFPTPSGIKELVIIDVSKIPFMEFIATLPGNIIVSVIFMVFFMYCKRKLAIIKKAKLNYE